MVLNVDGEAWQAVVVLQISVLVELIDALPEPGVEETIVDQVQSEKVVLDVQDVDVDVDEVEESDSEDELSSSFSSLVFSSISVTISPSSSKYSVPFSTSLWISSVTSSASGGITSSISDAIGFTQLIAAPAISFALPTVAPAACEARSLTALNRSARLLLDPAQGDLLESKFVLER